MKKILLTILIGAGLFAFASAQDQITAPQTSSDVGITPLRQGNWMIGASLADIGYSFEGNAFNLALQPAAGYFVSDGLAIGAQAILGLTAVKDKDNEWQYGIAPFVRYYFPGTATATGRFFGHGNVGIAGSSVGSDVAFNLGAKVGYSHFVTQTVALEATFGYNYNKANISTDGGASGLGVGLGFQIYLPGNR